LNDKEATVKFARGLQLLCETFVNDLDQNTGSVASKPFQVEPGSGGYDGLKAKVLQAASGTVETFDPSKVKWLPKSGAKGPFELATIKDNVGNVEYDKMVALVQTAGSLTKDKLWYWLFPTGEAVGRKTVRK
jgi:hypothetical protein